LRRGSRRNTLTKKEKKGKEKRESEEKFRGIKGTEKDYPRLHLQTRGRRRARPSAGDQRNEKIGGTSRDPSWKEGCRFVFKDRSFASLPSILDWHRRKKKRNQAKALTQGGENGGHRSRKNSGRYWRKESSIPACYLDRARCRPPKATLSSRVGRKTRGEGWPIRGWTTTCARVARRQNQRLSRNEVTLGLLYNVAEEKKGRKKGPRKWTRGIWKKGREARKKGAPNIVRSKREILRKQPEGKGDRGGKASDGGIQKKKIEQRTHRPRISAVK